MRKFTAAVSAFALVAGMTASAANAAVTVLVPTPAADPGQVELDGMQATCDAAAAAHDALNGDIWSGEVNLGPVTYVSGPTESGTHSIADAIEGTLEGAGTFTPAHLEILGDPYRNGGSVNMFGMQQSVGGRYSASEYDFEGEFDTVYSHAYSCDIYNSVFVPEVPQGPVQGYYVVEPTDQGNEEAGQQSCNAFTALGSAWEHWGFDHAQCDFIKTGDGTPGVPEHNDPPVFVVNEPQTAIEVTQTDTLLAHEDAGEGFDTSETLLIGQVVVCISPTTGTQTKKGAPGTWVLKNGYTGNKCTTAWYNGTTPYTTSNYAGTNVPNLNTGSHNWVTVPLS